VRDRIGRFDYGQQFFRRYGQFFRQARGLPADAVVLVIGANDGVVADPSAHVWQPGWRGYFVEPNPAAMARLKSNRDGVFIASAVAEQAGTLTLWTMTDEAASAYERVGANGTCLTSHDREHIVSRIRTNLADTAARLGEDSMVKAIQVPAMRVTDLLTEYEIPTPDLIQVDIEGMEAVVVPQCLELGAQIVLWEHQHEPDKDALELLAEAEGYRVVRLRNDSMATRC
jgi:FkbM family methyltransferase